MRMPRPSHFDRDSLFVCLSLTSRSVANADDSALSVCGQCAANMLRLIYPVRYRVRTICYDYKYPSTFIFLIRRICSEAMRNLPSKPSYAH
ncbi:hypothetical protein BDW67DRAFT_165075 [Aspergillus spinulosporus]